MAGAGALIASPDPRRVDHRSDVVEDVLQQACRRPSVEHDADAVGGDDSGDLALDLDLRASEGPDVAEPDPSQTGGEPNRLDGRGDRQAPGARPEPLIHVLSGQVEGGAWDPHGRAI